MSTLLGMVWYGTYRSLQKILLPELQFNQLYCRIFVKIAQGYRGEEGAGHHVLFFFCLRHIQRDIGHRKLILLFLTVHLFFWAVAL